jgi:hypothetical protein
MLLATLAAADATAFPGFRPGTPPVVPDRVEVLREDADLALPATQPPGPQRVKSGGSFHHANDPFRLGLALPASEAARGSRN